MYLFRLLRFWQQSWRRVIGARKVEVPVAVERQRHQLSLQVQQNCVPIGFIAFLTSRAKC